MSQEANKVGHYAFADQYVDNTSDRKLWGFRHEVPINLYVL